MKGGLSVAFQLHEKAGHMILSQIEYNPRLNKIWKTCTELVSQLGTLSTIIYYTFNYTYYMIVYNYYNYILYQHSNISEKVKLMALSLKPLKNNYTYKTISLHVSLARSNLFY